MTRDGHRSIVGGGSTSMEGKGYGEDWLYARAPGARACV